MPGPDVRLALDRRTDGVARKGRLDPRSVGGGEPLSDAGERGFVDVGRRHKELDPDRNAGVIDIYPRQRIDYLDGPGNISALKRDVGGVRIGVVPDDHNLRLPFLASVGDGDDDVRFCSGGQQF
jgi:hypothetical protein